MHCLRFQGPCTAPYSLFTCFSPHFFIQASLSAALYIHRIKKLPDTHHDQEALHRTSEYLSRKLQFLFFRKAFIEFFDIGIIHIIAPRRPVYTCYTVKIARDKFPADKE